MKVVIDKCILADGQRIGRAVFLKMDKRLVKLAGEGFFVHRKNGVGQFQRV